ncbi:alpha-1-antitrypsin [Anolis carolinensis]|uniref:Thyroxine-binding globulin n=1 Tax=Anolis carolinensis TaxID=28377 RepID=G1KCM4_ANOCA|nr:PREDICTED: alpha-1-antitrypsin isoform X2 [Anolis carolinensis]|eukprot:XP_016846249.1 PREDICTED: alpha-1-antitrypsin isoform X2 [Anolis carolinensis]
MRILFFLFFFIVGSLANNPYPDNSGHPNNNNNWNNNYRNEIYGNRENQPNTRNREMPNQVLVNSNFDFAFKFFREVSSNRGQGYHSRRKNIVFSPMCISSAFAMLALGARANTLDQILRGLDFRPSEIQEKTIHESFHDLIYMLNNAGPGLQMEMGNCLFVEKKLHPQEQFLYGLRNIYGGDIYLENFKNTVETEQHINDYVERKTHGKIARLVDGVDPITEILLISYMYLKAKWKKPFNPKYTEMQNFYIDSYNVVKVPMMFQMGMFEAGRDDERSCTVLKMPYEGHAAAYFILPDKGQLDKVARSLSCGALRAWKKILTKSSVNVYLPKCMAIGELHLKDIMYTMGVVDVFTDKADLSGITGQPRHRLSEAIHKAMMLIDERGTEAAAASSMDLVPMSTPTVLKFNMPFIAMVVEENTESILFMATIINPNEK